VAVQQSIVLSASILSKKTKMFYLFVLIAKIIFTSVLVAGYPDSFLSPDSGSYMIPAANLFDSMQFVNESGPEVFRTPGYSIFLAPAFLLGVSVISYAAFLQLLLVFVCAYLVFKITVQISENQLAGHIAAFLTLASPEITLSQHAVLSEILFTFLLTLAAYSVFSWHRSGKLIMFLLAFLLLTIATFVRPTSLYLPYVLALLIILYLFISDAIQKKFITFTIVLLALTSHTIAIDLWKDRNAKVSGAREFSTAQSVLMVEYLAAGIAARAESREWGDVRKEYINSYNVVPPEERQKFASEIFFASIKNYPIESLLVFTKGLSYNVMGSGIGSWINFFNQKSMSDDSFSTLYISPVTKILLQSSGREKFVYGFSLIGVIYISLIWLSFLFGVSRTKFSLPVLLLLMVIAYVLVVSSGTQSYSRFRVPVMPLIIVFASVGLTAWYQKKSRVFLFIPLDVWRKRKS